jgi:hypothetical protein
MNDDWRLRIDLHEHGFAHRLGERLAAGELEHDLTRSFRDRAVVSVEGSELFCYTGTRDQAERAEKLIREIAQHEGWEIEIGLAHWHPQAERWEDPDAPLAAGAGAAAAEREDRLEQEREESTEQGYPEFEVRVQCGSRHEAGELSHRLSDEGIANIHRWSWVLIGARDEDDGHAIAERLRGELPGAEISVESNLRAVWDSRPGNPFAWLGGLAG